MTTVAILPVPTEKGGLSYRGIAGNTRSEGSTPGEALDALTRQLGDGGADAGAGLLVVVQGLRPDRFFEAAQQQRLTALMGDWRAARDRRQTLPRAEQSELDALVEAELHASSERADTLANELQS